jgi:UDP-galactose transporter B1
LALANGLSFPVATLAKSGKMAPVMIGSLILGGASYG